MLDRLTTIAGRTLVVGDRLGGGGEGEVYAVANRPAEAIKIFHRDKVDAGRRRKLKHMVSRVNSELAKHAAWPMDLVDNGVFGVVMPRATGVELHEVYGPKSRMRLLPNASFKYLTAVAYNLCAALQNIHSVGAVVGDFNQRNVVVAENGTAWFVDCDSFQIHSGSELFLCTVGTPENTAPELQREDLSVTRRNPNHDNFALAVLVFQLLFMGRHPFAGVGGPDFEMSESISRYLYAYGPTGAAAGIRPPDQAPRLDTITPGLAAMFERAFSPASIASGRPTAIEWAQELKTLMSGLGACSSISAHLYLRTRSKCPWCEIYGKYQVVFFLLGGDHVFKIEAATIAELADRILAAQPFGFSLPAVTAGASGPAFLPRTVGQKSPSFWFGFPLMAVAIAGLVSGHPILGIMVGIWAGLLFVDLGAAERRRGDGKKLKAEVDSSCRALDVHVANLRSVHATYLQEFERGRNSATPLRREYVGLPEERKKRIDRLNRRLEDLQRNEFLDRCFILNADIPGVGDKRKSMLRGYNIETAADITQSLRVPGFGYDLKNRLLAWRQQQEAKFRFDPSRKLDSREIQKVDATLLVRKAELEHDLKSIRTTLEGLSGRARTAIELGKTQIPALAAAKAQAEINLKAFDDPTTYPRASGQDVWKWVGGWALLVGTMVLSVLATKNSPPPAQASPTNQSLQPAALTVPTLGTATISTSLPSSIAVYRIDVAAGTAANEPAFQHEGSSEATALLEPGKYIVEARPPGWRSASRTTIVINAGSTTPVSFVFKTSRVTFTSTPSAAEVHDGEQLLGITPLTQDNVADEPHTYVFSLPGVTSDSVEFSPQNAEESVNHVWSDGSLVIESSPGDAVVSDGGADLGKTPLTLYHLSPGLHRYTLSLEGYPPTEISPQIEAGEQTKMSEMLQPAVQSMLAVRFIGGSRTLHFRARGDRPIHVSQVQVQNLQGEVLDTVPTALDIAPGSEVVVQLDTPFFGAMKLRIASDPPDLPIDWIPERGPPENPAPQVDQRPPPIAPKSIVAEFRQSSGTLYVENRSGIPVNLKYILVRSGRSQKTRHVNVSRKIGPNGSIEIELSSYVEPGDTLGIAADPPLPRGAVEFRSR